MGKGDESRSNREKSRLQDIGMCVFSRMYGCFQLILEGLMYRTIHNNSRICTFNGSRTYKHFGAYRGTVCPTESHYFKK